MTLLRRVWITVAVLLLVGTQTGCMTGAMWHDARTEELTGPVMLAGRDLDGPTPSYEVVYEIPGTLWGPTYYLFVVPAELANDYTLSTQWANRITTAPAEADARPTAPDQAKVLPPEYFVRRLESKRVPAGTTEAERVATRRPTIPNRLTTAVFVFPAPDSTDPTGRTVHLQSGKDLVVTSRTRFVAFPGKQPRPTGDRSGTMIRAALLTPLTLVADVVVTPFIFFGHL